eukprot:scaffold101561_cov46-Cyclotella_meneghiniana.AAC.1
MWPPPSCDAETAALAILTNVYQCGKHEQHLSARESQGQRGMGSKIWIDIIASLIWVCMTMQHDDDLRSVCQLSLPATATHH